MSYRAAAVWREEHIFDGSAVINDLKISFLATISTHRTFGGFLQTAV